MYSKATAWDKWMLDYRFGTLVFVPIGSLRSVVDRLRSEYDSNSAQTSMAHITLTQPFAQAPTPQRIKALAKLIEETMSFEMVVGSFTTSPNKRLLWLDVKQKGNILSLREKLHETGLFRTDLPLTKGFIPHMTISEKGREPDEVEEIIEKFNSQFKPWSANFDSVTWIVPNEDFVFEERQTFKLG